MLASGLGPADVASLLAPYGIRDVKRADANLQAMAGEPRSRELLASILPDLLAAIGETADPDQALNAWERFLASVNRIQLFDYLRRAPRILRLLCTIFGNSAWMAETLVRDPLLVYWLAEEQVVSRRPTRRALDQALAHLLGNVTRLELKLDTLRRFRRRETLRIGVRDLLRLSEVPDTTATLSDLAEVLIQAALRVAETELLARYGVPRHRNGTGRWVETGFAVLALGKLGGRELNFSSDVDLLYVYESDEGRTQPIQATRPSGSSPGSVKGRSTALSISNEEYFEYLGRQLTQALSAVTAEGYVFRVDLRLRAEGSVGRLCQSLASYQDYYRARGKGWERLALLKAWPVAGRADVGRRFLTMVRPFVYDTAAASAGARDSAGLQGRIAELLGQVRGIKELIDAKMRSRQQEKRNVKLGTGGIREIEFIVQAVQALFGGRLAGIRARGTLQALERFERAGLLPAGEYAALSHAYLFLRDVEHKLQMVHDLQTHALPDDRDELMRCAVRLGYGADDRPRAFRRFLEDHRCHTARVHRLFQSLFYAPHRSPLLRVALRKEGGPLGRS